MVSRIASSAFSRFQSTLPARGATHHHHRHFGGRAISIHAPRTGSDACGKLRRKSTHRFQSTLPARGATPMRVMALPVPIFQSTLPARGATATRIPVDTHSIISIHAPRTGSDAPLCDGVAVGGISIHAPRTGSDAISLYCGNSVAEFQSTLPARGATAPLVQGRCRTINFNPRSPHGERHGFAAQYGGSRHRDFNPRSPHGERPCVKSHSLSSALFQSTLPARGATGTAPRNRADAPHFNPRSPHGERQGQRIFFCQASEFQSTLPARGATSAIVYAPRSTLFQSTLPARGATPTQRAEIISADISIHAPRTGSDAPPRRKRLSPERFQSTLPARGATGIWLNACFASLHFNPRSPHGERLHACLAVVLFRGDISIHAPRTGSDCRSGFHLPLLHISIHAPRTGSDAALPAAYVHGLYFNPRSPHGERRGTSGGVCPRVVFQSTLPARGATGFFYSGRMQS